MKSLLLLLVLVSAWAEWHVYGRKGFYLLQRSPMLLLWACVEVVLVLVSGYVMVGAFTSDSWLYICGVAVASVAGCAAGVSTSGVIVWRSR